MSEDPSDLPPKQIGNIQTKLAGRIDYAAKRGHEFSDSIRAWGELQPVSLAGVIADDKLSYRIVLHVKQQPDLDGWNRNFGDAMHNLRSVLNNAVAEIAHAEGLSNEQIKKIQFPIATSKKQWRDEKRRIRDLPTSVQEVIEKMQPFNVMPESPENHPLAILSTLSNQDKHRLELTPAIEPHQLVHDAAIEFEETPDPSILQDIMNRMKIDGRFEDGIDVITHDTTPYHVVQLIGHHQYQGSVRVVTDEGVRHSPADVMTDTFPTVINAIGSILQTWAKI